MGIQAKLPQRDHGHSVAPKLQLAHFVLIVSRDRRLLLVPEVFVPDLVAHERLQHRPVEEAERLAGDEEHGPRVQADEGVTDGRPW